MDEHLTEVFPDQLLQLSGRYVARSALVFWDNRVVPPADVVAATVPGGAGVRTLLASATADQRSQQIAVALVVARGALLVTREFLAHQAEDLLGHDRRHRH